MLKITKYCNTIDNQVYLNGNSCLSSNTGSIEEMIESLVKKYKITHPRFGKMDRLCQLGFTLSEMILQEECLKGRYKPEETGLVFSNSVSSLDTDKKFLKSTGTIASPALFVYTLPNIVIAEICIKNNFKGENYFFISESLDNGLLFNHISEMFDNKRLKACLGGWIDVIGDYYKALIFLVENDNTNEGIYFTEENIINIYNTK